MINLVKLSQVLVEQERVACLWLLVFGCFVICDVMEKSEIVVVVIMYMNIRGIECILLINKQVNTPYH